MLVRLMYLAVVVSLPVIVGGQTVSPREKPLLATATDLRPFTVAVVDEQTGKPVTEFAYCAQFKAPGRVRAANAGWQSVDSPSGTFVVQAPPAFFLTIDVTSSVMAGPRYYEFLIRSSDVTRRAVLKLRRGVTIHGTVRDATTREPVAGATMTAVILDITAPVRHATSDRDGHFEVHGVDAELGVSAYHPDYGEQVHRPEVAKNDESVFEVYLTPLDRGIRRGIVRDATGQPLEGVTVSDDERHVQTTRGGAYALDCVLGPPGHHVTPALTYSTEGFVTRQLWGDEVGKDGFVAVLQHQIPFEIQVLGPDGQPVKSFAVCIGPDPASHKYVRLKSVERMVKDDTGKCRLELARAGKTWVGIRAPGYANWEAETDVPQSGGTFVVRLENGVSITGRVVVPRGGLAKLGARLIPRRNDDETHGFGSISEFVDWFTLTTTVAADGRLRFDHVRPDRYTFHVAGPRVIPRMLVFDVSPGGLDLGQLILAGRGRLKGRVFHWEHYGGGIWPFAEGRVESLDSPCEDIELISDENGRFSVEAVPVGLARVGFHRRGALQEEPSEDWVVQVCEDRTTEVGLFDPVGSRPLTIEFRIGDGSPAQYETGAGIGAGRNLANLTEGEPMFKVELTPRSRQPLSFIRSASRGLNARGRIVLPDVSPGPYHLRVLGESTLAAFDGGVFFEQEISVLPGAVPVKVSLGAGSITGRFVGAGAIASKGNTVAPLLDIDDNESQEVDVIAVASGGHGATRRTRCDINGNYCVRYLDPGSYTLFAHLPKGGWSRIDNLRVASDVTDVGERTLARGGTIRGSISFRQPCPMPEEVLATGPSRVGLKFPIDRRSRLDRFVLGGLWPGQWTVALCSADRVLATAQTEIARKESVSIALTVEPEKRP